MDYKQAKLILSTYWDIENNKIEAKQIEEAYKCIPNHVNDVHQSRMIMGIKRYVIMNLFDLEYTIANSDITINEILDEIERERIMPTELIIEQSQPQVDNTDVKTIPDVPNKKKSGRPKGSKKK